MVSVEKIVVGQSKFQVSWADVKLSRFDYDLLKLWEQKMKENVFRYQLKIKQEKHLGNKYGFFVQLNTDGPEKRRRSGLRSTKLLQPFDPDRFNFSDLAMEEFMFLTTNDDGSVNYITINDSPIEKGHSLLIPQLENSLPQVITIEALKFGLGVLLESADPSLRIGFNGLCAYASVNHLHLHAYYLNSRMMLETVPVIHLSGNCYYQSVFPSKGFVFQICSWEEFDDIVKDIYKLSSYLIANNLAHNLVMTRGRNFKSKNPSSLERDCVRIYIWIRQPAIGAKEVYDLSPAICELFGHFPLKDKNTYDEVTEDALEKLLKDLTETNFDLNVDNIRKLFMNQQGVI